MATSPSFLSSVLTNAAEAELLDLNLKVKELEKSIQLLQVEAHEDLCARYDDYDNVEITDCEYLQTAQTLIEEADDASARIAAKLDRDLDTFTKEFEILQDSLKESIPILLTVNQLLLIDDAIQSVSKANSERRYMEAAIHCSKIQIMLSKLTGTSESKKLLQILKKEFNFCQAMLTTTLDAFWRKSISWKELEQSSDCKTAALKISRSQILKLPDTLKALYHVGSLNPLLSMFGNRLLKDMLTPIITCVTAVKKEKFEDHALLSVKIFSPDQKPKFAMVAENVTKVFDFLEEEVSFLVTSESTWLNMLGRYISAKFFEELSNAVTLGSFENIDAGRVTLKEVYHKFVSSLDLLGFMHNDRILECHDKLMQYNEFGACRVLDTARSIMKKNLHEMVLIREGSSNTVIGIMQNGFSENDDGSEHARNGENSFTFSSCAVSKSIVELIQLIEEVLKEEKSFAGDCRLEAARSIVSFYITFAPGYHRESIETLRAEAALFHNNCMFLAHRLILMGFEYQTQTGSDDAPQFMVFDRIQSLRILGLDSLFKFFQKERRAVVEATKALGLAKLSENSAKFEEHVRASLEQVEHLHSVWKDILAGDLHTKLIGGLINSWLEELINIVISADKITDDVALNLVLNYKYVVKRVLELMKVQGDLNVYVNRWNRFNAVIDILGCTLNEIGIKWSSGVFNREFRAEHVKALIRALFDDSQTRSHVLARIV